jgi:hypothetical protein
MTGHVENGQRGRGLGYRVGVEIGISESGVKE